VEVLLPKMWEYFDLPTLGRLARPFPGLGSEPPLQWRTRTSEVDLCNGGLNLCYGSTQHGPVPIVAIRQLGSLFQALGSDGQQYLVRKRAFASGKSHLALLYFEILSVPWPSMFL